MIVRAVKVKNRTLFVACDANCNKAFGRDDRPRGDHPDDSMYIPDDLAPDAPIDPGSRAGADAKPRCLSERLNAWCRDICERSVVLDAQRAIAPEASSPVVTLPDFTRWNYVDPKLGPLRILDRLIERAQQARHTALAEGLTELADAAVEQIEQLETRAAAYMAKRQEEEKRTLTQAVANARMLLLMAEGKVVLCMNGPVATLLVDGREFRCDVQAHFPGRKVEPPDVRLVMEPFALKVWDDQHIDFWDIVPMEAFA